MSDNNGSHHGYEDSHILPVASPQYLLGQVLDRLAALEEREKAREEELIALREETARQKEEIVALREEVALERAYDRQRISKLEAPAPVLSQKTGEAHLNRLFSEMKRLRMRQTTTRDAARLMGISKDQAKKLKPYLAADFRFTLLKDPHHKQRYLIILV